MTRNFLVFLFGLVLLLIFSFVFCYASIYAPNLDAVVFWLLAVLALVGFIAVMVVGTMIGIASRDEGGSLFIWFLGLAGVTGVLFVWYVTRAGTLLGVW